MDFTEGHLKEWHGCPWIVGVDIFPLDVLPDNEEEKEALLALTDALRLIKGICRLWRQPEEGRYRRRRLPG